MYNILTAAQDLSFNALYVINSSSCSVMDYPCHFIINTFTLLLLHLILYNSDSFLFLKIISVTPLYRAYWIHVHILYLTLSL